MADDRSPAEDLADDPDTDPADALPRMTLTEHLDELRRRVVRAALALLVGMVVAFVFYKDLFQFVSAPFREAVKDAGGDVTSHLQGLSPLEAFITVMKLCFLTGVVATAPYVLAQMWGFIAAGLYDHEKKAVRTFFPISVVLFAFGCAMAYLMILPVGLRFLIGFSHTLDVTTNFGVGDYLSLLLSLVFGMGIAFQMPLLILFLEATGLVEREAFAKNWRIAVLSAFVVAMIVTPDPTPVSQILMALPLVGLYFLGVWGGRFVGGSRERFHWWKAWPLALAISAFVLLFVFRRDLATLAGRLFS